MSSVLTDIECPQCGARAWLDYYCRTGEEYVSCEWCGFARSLELTNGEWVVEEIKAHAAVEHREKGRRGKWVGPVENAEELTKWISGVDTSRDLFEAAVYRRFVDGRWEETDVLTGTTVEIHPPLCDPNPPYNFDDECEQLLKAFADEWKGHDNA